MIYLLTAIALLGACSTPSNKEKTMTALPFEVTGAEAAMPMFQQGLLLLHNFEYDDAAEAFREAQKLDADFTMAYWGEAMTYNHPVWRNQQTKKAQEVLNRLGEKSADRLARAKTGLEKDFISSVDLLYEDGRSKTDRDIAYSEAMKSMYDRYPGNHEVAAFYALSLLGIKEGWNKEQNITGAQIAESILKENPRHPGALHYLIHSDDHPEYAQFALAAANDYADVASYAGHALHMPSHIYLALGMWDEVVKSNEVSWQAGVDRREAKGLTNDALNYHAYWWLAYGYLQQGRFEAARKVLDNQLQYATALPSARARFHLQAIKGHYLVETNDWSGAVQDIFIDSEDLSLVSRSAGRLIQGMAAYHRKDAQALAAATQLVEEDLAVVNRLTLEKGVAVCGATLYADGIPSEGDFLTASMALNELKGLSAWLRKDHAKAASWFEEAAALEDKIGYFFGPPDIVKPPHELYGEFLLATGRPADADIQFDLALKRAPGRVRSLKGSLEASKQIKNPEKVAEREKQLQKILKNADRKSEESV